MLNPKLQAPPFFDWEKWNDRLLTNLLYYQTNYFAFMLVIILVNASVQLRNVLIGLFAISVLAAALIFSLSSNPTVVQVRLLSQNLHGNIVANIENGNKMDVLNSLQPYLSVGSCFPSSKTLHFIRSFKLSNVGPSYVCREIQMA